MPSAGIYPDFAVAGSLCGEEGWGWIWPATGHATSNLISELGMALAIHLMDFLDGLSIKRDRGIENWGHMIEGHGGMPTGWTRFASPRRSSST
jgi:hypothetical protein